MLLWLRVDVQTGNRIRMLLITLARGRHFIFKVAHMASLSCNVQSDRVQNNELDLGLRSNRQVCGPIRDVLALHIHLILPRAGISKHNPALSRHYQRQQGCSRQVDGQLCYLITRARSARLELSPLVR